MRSELRLQEPDLRKAAAGASFRFDRAAEPAGRFPERVSLAAPPGTKAAVQLTAEASGMSVAEFLRHAVTAQLAPLPRLEPAASSAIVFEQERFASIRREIGPLWRAHWDEIGQDKDRVPLDPDVDKYGRLDADGHLLIVTARKAGFLVGYVFCVIDTHLHYRSTIFAQLDLYYLAPAVRGGRSAFRMFRTAERALRARRVVKVIGPTKLAHDHGRLFEFLGWRETERLFTKTFGAT